LEKYGTTKREAEEYLLSEECKNLKPTIIRPGFIVHKDERWWSIPVGMGCDLMWYMNENVGKTLPIANQIDFLFPAKSVQLSTVAHFAIEGALGKITEKILPNSVLIEYEA
jgi:hypothetical protein